jgi:hypothetical protein
VAGPGHGAGHQVACFKVPIEAYAGGPGQPPGIAA